MLYTVTLLGAWTVICWFSVPFGEPFLGLPLFALPWYVPLSGFLIAAAIWLWQSRNGTEVDASVRNGEKAPRRAKALLTAIILVHLALHLPSAFLYMGANDSDSALSGLAGVDIVEKGERPMFRYGLHYIGTTLPHAAAVVQFLTGPLPVVQRLLHIAMYTGFILLVWSLGRKILGEAPALAAAAIAAVPPYAMMLHLRYPEFVETLFWGMLSFLILARALAEKSLRAQPLFLYGLVSGILFYAHPQGIIFLVAGLLTLLLADKLFWSRLNALLLPAGFCIGAIVVFIDSYYYDWIIFRVFFGSPVRDGSVIESLEQGLGETLRLLPFYLGFGGPGSPLPEFMRWFLLLGFVALVVVSLYALRGVIKKAVTAQRSSPAALLPLLLFFTTLAVFALSDRSSPPATLRYLTPLWAAVPFIIATPLAMAKRTFTRVAAWAAVGTGIAIMGISIAFYYLDVAKEESTWREWTSLCREKNIETFFGDFWIAYQTTFITSRHIIGSSAYPVDYTPYDANHYEVMAASEPPAYIFSPRYDTESGERVAWFANMLKHLGIRHRTVEIGLGTVFFGLSERLTPAQFQSIGLLNGARFFETSVAPIADAGLYLLTFNIENSGKTHWFANGSHGHVELTLQREDGRLLRRQPLMRDVAPGEAVQWRALISATEVPTGGILADVRLNDIIITEAKQAESIRLDGPTTADEPVRPARLAAERMPDFSFADGWGASVKTGDGATQVWSGADQTFLLFVSEAGAVSNMHITVRPLSGELLPRPQKIDVSLNGTVLVADFPVEKRTVITLRPPPSVVKSGLNVLRLRLASTEPTYSSARLRNEPVFRFRPKGILLLDFSFD